jgi:hypothetical protein
MKYEEALGPFVQSQESPSHPQPMWNKAGVGVGKSEEALAAE